MKVPVPVTSRTTQFGGRLTPVRVDGVSIDAFGGGMARGLGAVGEALNTLGTTVQRKNEQNAKFQTLTNFTEFETRVAQALTELKRGASPDGKGYLAAASQLYKKEEDSFFAGNVPPELEQEGKTFRLHTPNFNGGNYKWISGGKFPHQHFNPSHVVQ